MEVDTLCAGAVVEPNINLPPSLLRKLARQALPHAFDGRNICVTRVKAHQLGLILLKFLKLCLDLLVVNLQSEQCPRHFRLSDGARSNTDWWLGWCCTTSRARLQC